VARAAAVARHAARAWRVIARHRAWCAIFWHLLTQHARKTTSIVPLTPAGELVAAAYRRSAAIAAFNVIGLEHVEGVIAGAEAAASPAILQISENTVRFHGGLEPLAVSALAAARGARVPIGVHLDHATAPELVEAALELGIGSVMFDAAERDFDSNADATRAIAERCHRLGAWIEGELGAIGGKAGAAASDARTDPEQAAAYVAATRVDALAVAVGSSHQMVDRVARLDLALIRRLRDAVPAPLVLHGSSGVADRDLVAAVAAGVTKINIATLLNRHYVRALSERLVNNKHTADPRPFLGAGRDALAREVARLLQLLRSV
jgi:fructose-bisphosphate aldolase class II